MNKLTGRIYWFLGDIKHLNGEYKTIATSTILTDIIIDENMVKFDWQPTNDTYGGTVNLLSTHGAKLNGSAKVIDGDDSIIVTAEMFENIKGVLLKGEWIEDTDIYTWWADFQKL